MYRMVIEIAAIDGQAPASLVVKGYRFSRYGPVAFVLNQVRPDALNRILDPVVPGLGLAIPGVTYIGIDSSRAILDACRTARLILGSSQRFRALVDCLPAAVGRTQRTTMLAAA